MIARLVIALAILLTAAACSKGDSSKPKDEGPSSSPGYDLPPPPPPDDEKTK